MSRVFAVVWKHIGAAGESCDCPLPFFLMLTLITEPESCVCPWGQRHMRKVWGELDASGNSHMERRFSFHSGGFTAVRSELGSKGEKDFG